MVYRGLVDPIGLVPVQKGHLKAVVLVKELIHGCELDCHGQLVRIDEVERLGHDNKHLLVDPLGYAVLP